MNGGGPAKVIHEMSERLAKRGHKVTVVGTDAGVQRGRVDILRERSQTTYALRVHRVLAPGAPYFCPSMARDIWRQAGNHDVMHVHGLFNFPVTSAQAIASARNLPYVVRACGMLNPYGMSQRGKLKRAYYFALERRNLQRAARLQVTSELEYVNVKNLDLDVSILRLAQGVESAHIGKGNRKKPYILFLSRISPKKGLPLLLDSFAAIADQRPLVELVIAGPEEGNAGDEARRKIADLGLSDRAHLVGPVWGQAKADLLAGAEVLALPSHSENFGIVVVEAAAQGTPVLVTPQVGLAPEIIAARSGRVVPRTTEAWADALRSMSTNKQERGRSDRCRRFAAGFGWDAAIECLETTYLRIVAERSPM